MDEIPTVVLDLLPPALAAHAEAGGAGARARARGCRGDGRRPYALVQWALHHRHTIPEQHIFISEPDHLLRAPPPLPAGGHPIAYPFFYMAPRLYHDILSRKFNAKGVALDRFQPTGGCPLVIDKDQFAGLALGWHDAALALRMDPEADAAFGWVKEMYAYVIAAAHAEGGPVAHRLLPHLMVEPPYDESLVVVVKELVSMLNEAMDALAHTWPPVRGGGAAKERRLLGPEAFAAAGRPWPTDAPCDAIATCPLGPPMPGPPALPRNPSTAALTRAAVAADQWPRGNEGSRYHVVITAGPGVGQQWQARVAHFWHRRLKQQFADGPLGGFTRVLHTGEGDELMGEVPTVVVPPLRLRQHLGRSQEASRWLGAGEALRYVQRPHALAHLLRHHGHAIPEDYLLILEPDMLLLLPPPLWAEERRPAAFWQIHKGQLAALLGRWLDVSLAMWRDPDLAGKPPQALDKLAYMVAAAQAEGGPIRHHFQPQFVAHPPLVCAPCTRQDYGLTLVFNPSFHPPLDPGTCPGYDPAPNATAAAAAAAARRGPHSSASGGAGAGPHAAAAAAANRTGPCPQVWTPYILHYTNDAAFGPDGTWLGLLPPGRRGAWHFSKSDFAASYPPHPFPPLPPGCAPQCEGVAEVLHRLGAAAAELPGWAARAA
eukprot:scaffold17.g564.t1